MLPNSLDRELERDTYKTRDWQERIQLFPEHIPTELREVRQWVCWKQVNRPGKPKPAKVPINPLTGKHADVVDLRTTSSFDEAVNSCTSLQLDGIGFVYHENDPFAGIDLDNCIDSDSGVLAPWAHEIVTKMETYTEVSPSGSGLKLFLKGRLPNVEGNRVQNIEIYDRARYFTVTGRIWGGCPKVVNDRNGDLLQLHSQLFPRTSAQNVQDRVSRVNLIPDDVLLVEFAKRARNGAKFERLFAGNTDEYQSASEADLALCRLIAFWTGPDVTRIDAIFRGSGLMRPKWDSPRQGSTYGKMTILKALSLTSEFFQGAQAPPAKSSDSAQLIIPPPCVSKSVAPRSHFDLLRSAYMQSKKAPCPPIARSYRGKLRKLVALCVHLQIMKSLGLPFGLDCRRVGKIFKIHHGTAARWLCRLVQDGVLVVIRKGTIATRHATEYRISDDWQQLLQQQA